MNFQSLSDYLQKRGEPSFRVRQVLESVYEGIPSFAEMTVLPRSLRECLSAEFPLLSFRVSAVQSSRDGGTYKARVDLTDGKRIETVLMQPKPGYWSVCVSSQVGCALACSFCATGLMGFLRNLTAEEIADQVLFWKQHIRHLNLKANISNVVFMGMGEPLLNFDAVKESIRQLTDPHLFGLGHRSIAVSTAGVVPGIDRFAEELKQVNLALSLHAANNALRTRLVPLNKAYPLEVLSQSLRRYFSHNNRKIFLEYVLLRDENDGPEHARQLVQFVRRTGPASLMHVNLIVWNPTDTAHQPASREQASRFKKFLMEQDLKVTIRKNLGQDIEGACGQLVTSAKPA
ncbi:MAG: 23S rRNA (adenine(2503)-C(2))-methyltransferase RlmN [Elusimicrobia bacterium]|nr:23S rRNA (adenine(2503)-C(2))-methyltransferase RlmN [Elusimicrobiota bacterium]